MFYPLQFCLIIGVTVVLATCTVFCGLLDADGKRAYRINQIWTRTVLRIAGISLIVRGLENIDPQRQYIFIANHQSNLDILALIQALAPFQLRWIAKKELLRVPFFGWALWATKHVTIDRSDRKDAAKSLARAQERLAAGISLVIFPEGTRSRDGHLQRFKKGGFLLALQTQMPIVPVTIKGSGSLLPARSWRLRAGYIEVVVDPPVSVESFRPGVLRLLSDQVREKIAAQLGDLNQPQAKRYPRSTASGGGNRSEEKRSA